MIALETNAFKNGNPDGAHPLWRCHYAYHAGDDRFYDECALFGIFGVKEAAKLTALGLHALQHRGQEATGIVTYDLSSNDEKFHSHRAFGLVGDSFSSPYIMDSLKGNSAIGHNRYSTSGGKTLRNVQPLYAELSCGAIAMAHNGNLTNAIKLRQQLMKDGNIFHTTLDSEVLLHLLSNHTGQLKDRIIHALHHITGAYAFVILSDNALIGIRDPLGIRPLVLGKLGDSHILASETVAFDIIGAEFIRDVAPGEMVIITSNGIYSECIFDKPYNRPCMFEYVYFTRPDSIVNGRSIHHHRRSIGKELAKEHPTDSDLVFAIPDSGIPSAMGYSEETKISYDVGIIRNHYIGRTFIEPSDQIRHLGVRMKHNANKEVIKNRRVTVIDDSLVRGTTAIKLVEMLRNAGAREVHMRIASPMVKFPCYYGIDLPTHQELLANTIPKNTDMCKHIGADTLEFISIDGLYRALGDKNGRDNNNPQYTDHYFTGDYPTSIPDFDDSDNDLPLLKHGLLSEKI